MDAPVWNVPQEERQSYGFPDMNHLTRSQTYTRFGKRYVYQMQTNYYKNRRNNNKLLSKFYYYFSVSLIIILIKI